MVGRLFGIDTTTPLAAGGDADFISATAALVAAALCCVCVTWPCRFCNCWFNVCTCSCSARIWLLRAAVPCAYAGVMHGTHAAAVANSACWKRRLWSRITGASLYLKGRRYMQSYSINRGGSFSGTRWFVRLRRWAPPHRDGAQTANLLCKSTIQMAMAAT